MKLCPSCGTEKALNEFHLRKGGKHQGYCKPCAKEITNRWRRENYNPDKKRAADFRHKYGIDLNDYDQMFAAQNGCCQVCLVHQDALSRRLAVDHCHASGKVRGLLCDNCNTALGKVNDNIETLQRAIEYLRAAAEG